jgi:integrase
VRQSAKRERIPDVLEVPEITAIMGVLREPFRTMVLVAAATGMRRSELFALKWQDVSFDSFEIRLTRSIYYGVVGELKTEASKKPVPLDPDLAAALQKLRSSSEFNAPDD